MLLFSEVKTEGTIFLPHSSLLFPVSAAAGKPLQFSLMCTIKASPRRYGRRCAWQQGGRYWSCDPTHAVKWKSLSQVWLYDLMDCSPWNSPGQNIGAGSHSLLQGIFPTQGPNPGLPHCGKPIYPISIKHHHRLALIKLVQLSNTQICSHLFPEGA